MNEYYFYGTLFICIQTFIFIQNRFFFQVFLFNKKRKKMRERNKGFHSFIKNRQLVGKILHFPNTRLV